MAEVHITYEIERLVLCLPIQSQVAMVAHPIISQSLLEAFLVHLRSLADFVVASQRPRHEMDVAAEDYYDGDWAGQPTAVFGHDPEEHQKCMNELHRRLAHISIQRASSDEFIWRHAVQKWLPELVSALRAFIHGLPEERRRWFSTAERMLSSG